MIRVLWELQRRKIKNWNMFNYFDLLIYNKYNESTSAPFHLLNLLYWSWIYKKNKIIIMIYNKVILRSWYTFYKHISNIKILPYNIKTKIIYNLNILWALKLYDIMFRSSKILLEVHSAIKIENKSKKNWILSQYSLFLRIKLDIIFKSTLKSLLIYSENIRKSFLYQDTSQ